MLCVYEQKGSLKPSRTQDGTRRYGGQELDRIGEIATLLAAGLNLAGLSTSSGSGPRTTVCNGR